MLGTAIDSVNIGSPDELTMDIEATAGYVIVITGLGILLEMFFIVMRFCNIGVINSKSKLFFAFVSGLS